VDACVVALAERLDVREVAALDRRDFQVIAPRHLRRGERLRLLPDGP
jgi:predicted nucleic acid-binding protein